MEFEIGDLVTPAIDIMDIDTDALAPVSYTHLTLPTICSV